MAVTMEHTIESLLESSTDMLLKMSDAELEEYFREPLTIVKPQPQASRAMKSLPAAPARKPALSAKTLMMDQMKQAGIDMAELDRLIKMGK